MRRRTDSRGCLPLGLACACLSLWTPSWAAAQTPRERLAVSQTLREALSRSGFEPSAVLAPGARDLDRSLTSSSFDSTGAAFAAAYYFKDEVSGGQGLGALHVSLFDRRDGRWIHAPNIDDAVGSALSVQITASYILVGLHGNPSSGQGLVLDARRLEVIASLSGFGLQLMVDGSIGFVGNMVHFAPTHQERLLVFDPKALKETEIFPGRRESPIATGYRRTIRNIYARLPQSKKDEYRQSAYGPVSDFDRMLGTVIQRDDGARIAFTVEYACDRFHNDVAHPVVHTIVRCDRQTTGTWSCNERDLEQRGRDAGIPFTREAGGRYEQTALDTLIRAVLQRP